MSNFIRTSSKKLTIAGALSALLAVTPLCVFAQQSDGGGLEEIVVTAERRSESLQDVPMSIVAISGDDVNPAGISDLGDIANATPNFNFTQFNLSEPQIYIRGIGNTNDSGGSDPAVAVFLDDVYLGRPSSAGMDLYDVERIEVLRGPQGTLYGKNAAGGTISVVTRKPQQEFEAKAGVTVGDYSLFRVGAYVNGPLSDTIAGKLVVDWKTQDGYAENITTGQDLEDADTKSVRGQLLFTPSESVDVLLGFDYTDMSGNGAMRYLTNLDIAGLSPLANIPALIALQEQARAGLSERQSSADIDQYAEKTLSGFLARVDAGFDFATLTSITAYRTEESAWLQPLVPLLSSEDGGLGIYEVNDWADQDGNQFSQEFRLYSEGERLKWLLGLFYLDEDVDRSETFTTYWQAGTPLAGLSPGDVTFNQSANNKSSAVFGQLTWDATDTLSLTLGMRYTKDKKSIYNQAIDNIDGIPPTGIPLVGAPYEISASASWSQPTSRLSVEWRPTDNAMLYATYSEGFKSGAFNGTQGDPVAASTPLEPETADNIEVGAKTQWFDNRLRFNLTIFDLSYDDLQVWYLENAVLVAANATASVDGYEADFAWAITDDFIVSGGFAGLDGTYDEYVTATEDYTGNDLPRAPDSSWYLKANYTMPLRGGAALAFVGSASYTDGFTYEPSNDPRQWEPDKTIYDASVKYLSADDVWDVTLWGKNLTDELYGVHGISGTYGGASRIWGPPLTWGVSFNYSWN